MVVVADVAALGAFDAHGLASDRDDGLDVARAGSRKLAHGRCRRSSCASAARSSARRSRRPSSSRTRRRRSTGYLDERSASYPGFTVTYLPSRSYPQGAFGSTFLGLLGEVSPRCSHRSAYAHAQDGRDVGNSGVEATYDRILNGGFDRARVRVDSLGRVVGRLQHGTAAARCRRSS